MVSALAAKRTIASARLGLSGCCSRQASTALSWSGCTLTVIDFHGPLAADRLGIFDATFIFLRALSAGRVRLLRSSAFLSRFLAALGGPEAVVSGRGLMDRTEYFFKRPAKALEARFQVVEGSQGILVHLSGNPANLARFPS